MNALKLVLCAFLGLLLVGCPPPCVTWARLIGGSGLETVDAVVPTATGGYAAIGHIEEAGGNYQILLLLRDNMGDYVGWSTFGGAGEDRGYDLQQTPDGGYIVAGSYDMGTPAVPDHNFIVIREGVDGISIWNDLLGTAGADEVARAVDVTDDGGWVAAGVKVAPGNSSLYVAKWNSTGVLEWDEDVGGVGGESGFAVQQTADGGYMAAGWSDSYGSAIQMYLAILDSAGSFSWSATCGGAGNEVAEAAAQTSDNGYILAGCSTSFSRGDEDAYVVKLDEDGVLQWDRVFSGPYFDGVKDIVEVANGGYVLVYEQIKEHTGADSAIVLVKLNAAGATQWTRTYDGPGRDRPTSVAVANDGGYIIGGYTDSWTAGDFDAYLIKTDRWGNAPAVPTD